MATTGPSTSHNAAGTTVSNESLTILIGLSGPSSSGKTTIARLLAQIFTHPASSPASTAAASSSSSLHILHQDDFYHTDTLIPLITTPADSASGLGSREFQDWDCASSLDVPLLERTLRHVKDTGSLPKEFESKEDKNSVGEVKVREGLVGELKGKVGGWLSRSKDMGKVRGLRIWLVDGFLLYPPPPSLPMKGANAASEQGLSEDERMRNELREKVTTQLDIKLFLLSSREQTIARRTRRTGYVTLEGFWEDPPGYVEDVVWPNYVRDQGWLMRRKGGEGAGTEDQEEDMMVDVDEEVAEKHGIRFVPQKGKADLSEVLEWAVGEVMEGVERIMAEDERRAGQ